jgi:hypothetical protein
LIRTGNIWSRFCEPTYEFLDSDWALFITGSALFANPLHGLWQPQYGTVSPRVGFAYDLFGNGRTSIRGGAGLSYERNFGNVTFNVIRNPPNYAVVVLNGSVNSPIPVTSSNAGPLAGSPGSVPLPPTSLRNVDENIRTAQTQFYSLALKHQMATNTILSIQYAGARGVHLYDIKNINGLSSRNVFGGDPLTDANGNVALTRLNNQYSNINNRGSNGDSYYHAMNVQFQTTDLHHTSLSLVANYTLAHSTDELSTAFSETNNAFFSTFKRVWTTWQMWAMASLFRSSPPRAASATTGAQTTSAALDNSYWQSTSSCVRRSVPVAPNRDQKMRGHNVELWPPGY